MQKSPKTVLKRDWPLFAAAVVLWVTVGIVYVLCLRREQGHFVYVLDDAYIHMAIAKHFAAHGVWGVTPYQFSSSSSSILWPLMLSLIYRLFGPHELVPLILNVVFATLTLAAAHYLLKKIGLPSGYLFFALLGMLFLTPLPALIFGGMEHSLQVLLTLPFVYLAAGEIARANEPGSSRSSRPSPWLLLLGGLMTLVRYEGLFLVLPVCLLFFLRRRWRYALELGAIAVAPVVIYGAVSAAKGWFWLPNSVLLKGNVPPMFGEAGIVRNTYSTFAWSGQTSHMLSLTVAVLVMFGLWLYKEKTFWKRSGLMAVIFTVAAVLHLKFARLGWFYRYEAYLVALGLFVAVAAGFEYTTTAPETMRPETMRKPRIPLLVEMAAACLIFFPLGPLWSRALYALRIPRVSRNIYEQQYQVGSFLKQFYGGVRVAANDIGAISFLGEARLTDLQGLGDLAVAMERRKGFLSAQQIDRLTKLDGDKVAVLQDRAFQNGVIAYDGLPENWIKVGEWKISDNLICSDDAVSFFAVEPAEEGRLTEALRQFAPRLPADIAQSGKYTEPRRGVSASASWRKLSEPGPRAAFVAPMGTSEPEIPVELCSRCS